MALLIMALIITLHSLSASLAPPDPLSCFVREPGSAPGMNVCPHTYELHPGHSVQQCATLCLADGKCQAFATGSDPKSTTDCRLSHDCAQPTAHLSSYDGYTRKPGKCGGPSPLPPPPPLPPPVGIRFHSKTGLFSDGMILQRGDHTVVWGEGARASAQVTVRVGGVANPASTTAEANGTWKVVLPSVAAMASTNVTATDGDTSVTLSDVAFGDVLLCGGQSNMGFGMCGAHSKTQTPEQALTTLMPLRMFFQVGSGPYGGAGGRGCPVTVAGEKASSRTTAHQWFASNATNSGGFSAICMLTAQRLYLALEKRVPVGAVESCVSGTPVEPWTPSNTSATTGGGALWQRFMVPLLPMTFKAAVWDQGERDAKTTSSSYYSKEFPLMIQLWRRYFTSAAGPSAPFPFVYVELCTEYGAEAPKESDFWLAQRMAVADDPTVGFAVTTDIQRALHPPDKQDVADRITLELRRLAYGQAIVSRGPEMLSSKRSVRSVTLTFSNASLAVHAGILVGNETWCAANAGNNTMAMVSGTLRSLAYTISGNSVSVECPAGVAAVHINQDFARCFLYSTTSGLPAPPVIANCSVTTVEP